MFKIKIHKIIITISFICLLFSCTENKNNFESIEFSLGEEKENFSFFENYKYRVDNAKDTLIIYASFSECGEWGGHDEYLHIYIKDREDFYINYKKYRVDCDSIGKNYGKPSFQIFESEKEIKINENQKVAITEFIKRMVISKTKERYPGHAGNFFRVSLTDSSLFISVYDFNQYNNKSYYKLLKELDLLNH